MGLLSLSALCCHQTLLALAELNSESICYPKAPGTVPAPTNIAWSSRQPWRGSTVAVTPAWWIRYLRTPGWATVCPGPTPSHLCPCLCSSPWDCASLGGKTQVMGKGERVDGTCCFHQNEQGARHPVGLVSGKWGAGAGPGRVRCRKASGRSLHGGRRGTWMRPAAPPSSSTWPAPRLCSGFS